MQNKWICLCLFYVVLNINAYYLRNRLPFLQDLEVCTTKTCELDAYRISNALNTSVNPCDDFYEFACGNWGVHNRRPSSHPTWSHWEPLIQIVEKRIQTILDDNDVETEFQPLNAAKLMYQSCIDVDKYKNENLMILYEVLKNFGGWPIISDYWINVEDWSVTVAKINSLINVHPLIKFHVNVNMYNTSRNALYIDHPTLIFPHSILSDPLQYKSHIQVYEKWILQCAQELMKISNISIPIVQLKREVYQIVQFEIQLANLISTDENETSLRHLFKQITLENLQLWTDLIMLKNSDNSVIWDDVMKTLFINVKFDIKSDEFIIMRNPQYLLKLIKLIDITTPRVVANYLGWSIVKQFAKDISQNMRNIFFEVDKLLLGIQDDISREKKCIGSINEQMGLIIGYQYVNKYFSLQTKKDVEKIVENIRSTLITKLKSIRWLDDETKFKSIEKARYIKSFVGYSALLKNTSFLYEYYKDLKITKNHLTNTLFWNEFIKTKELSKLYKKRTNNQLFNLPTEVNAFYNVLQNSIIIPAALLQFPFYSTKRLKVLNFGAIGTIIGHELSHAFDNTGRQADRNGNLLQWWSDESIKKYENNLKCFYNHYNKYTLQTVQKLSENNIQINSLRTQDENIADVIGLKLAYYTYQNIKQDFEMEWKLPGLENYTHNQYFFMSYANQWCETSSPEHILSEVLDDDHTPSKVRILGSLSNSEEFSKAFECPDNSPMNPKIKCELW